MNIEISGHHVDITDAMKSIAKKKFQKLEKRYADLGTISITVKVERNTQHIEVKTQFLGDTLSVSANSTDFYKAIDQVATKLDRSLSTRKGHIDTIGREKPELIDLDSSEEPELEDYE